MAAIPIKCNQNNNKKKRVTMKAIEWLDLDSINLVNPRKKSLWLLTIEKMLVCVQHDASVSSIGCNFIGVN